MASSTTEPTYRQTDNTHNHIDDSRGDGVNRVTDGRIDEMTAATLNAKRAPV